MSHVQQSTNRQAGKEQSKLNIKALKDPNNLKALKELYGMLKKCYGPYSSNILLQNELGGIVTSTSSCVQLLNALPLDNPLVRIITTAAIGHSNNFNDAGLFTALMTLCLVNSGLKLEQHRHLISSVNELLLGECLAFLSSEQCPAKIKLNFGSTEELLKLTISVIATKPGSVINKEESCQIARLVLISFISGISEKEVPSLHMVAIEGQQPMMSEIRNGFLYQAPELWNDEITHLKCKKYNNGSRIRTVLVGSSMAGDSEDFIGGHYEMHGKFRKEDAVKQQIKKWIESVMSLDVGILFCQKVVHQDIKELLQEKHHVIVIERLGTRGAKTVQRLTGGPLLHSFHAPLDMSRCGCVLSIEHVVLHERSFMEIRGVTEEVSSLMLCHASEEALDELKLSCVQAYDVLRQSLGQPYALQGGGCWITQLHQHLYKQAGTYLSSWPKSLECPRYQLPPVIQAFLSSLRHIPAMIRSDRDHYIDTAHGHHWMLPSGDQQPAARGRCVCAAVEWNEDIVLVAFEEFAVMNPLIMKSEVRDEKGQTLLRERITGKYSRNMIQDGNEQEQDTGVDSASVLDGFSVIMNGLQTAVLGANMVLTISNVISDCN